MYLSLLVFPLLLPAASSACINCGGADKTSAKRLKMPNKSVFTRLAGIELMEIFEITNQINHEICAQQCDAHQECAVFEFNLPNKLCVLASEYARLSDDLAKGAFETIVFVKVRGKFTKALPNDKETCLDKSEYEDYVKHEVDKWLNPSPKKSTSASAPDGEKTTATASTTTENSVVEQEEGSSAAGGINNTPPATTTSARPAAITTTAAAPSTTTVNNVVEEESNGAGATDISAPVTALPSTATTAAAGSSSGTTSASTTRTSAFSTTTTPPSITSLPTSEATDSNEEQTGESSINPTLGESTTSEQDEVAQSSDTSPMMESSVGTSTSTKTTLLSLEPTSTTTQPKPISCSFLVSGKEYYLSFDQKEKSFDNGVNAGRRGLVLNMYKLEKGCQLVVTNSEDAVPTLVGPFGTDVTTFTNIPYVKDVTCLCGGHGSGADLLH